MGKWTPDYIDDVLHSKIKNLVSGAIKRSALEKTDPRITYEDFVQDLDTGDSFTTSLIDILVKELAERKTRPRIHDRRFITPRSAKSLQDLSQRTFERRDNPLGPFRRHRREGLSDYLSVPPVEMDTEEDEESFENMLDNVTPLEGVRLNTEIYEAYGTNEAGLLPRPTISPAMDGAASPPPPPSAFPSSSFGRSGPWSMASNSGSTLPSPAALLTRQHSIRRPLRSSRTHDFNDFTLRRRSHARDTLLRDFDSNPREPIWGSSGGVAPARRFFPMPPSRRPNVENRLWSSVSRSGSPWNSISPPPGAHPLPTIFPTDNAPPTDWPVPSSWPSSSAPANEDEARTPTISPAIRSEGATAAAASSRRLHRGRAGLSASSSDPTLPLSGPADQSWPLTPPILSHIHSDLDRRALEAIWVENNLAANVRGGVVRPTAENEAGPPLVDYPTPRTSHEPDP